jgi:hypothetical protein
MDQHTKAPQHTDGDALDWVSLGETGWARASVTLAEGETAWNPASTRSVLVGPAVITYERAPDGGVTARVED